MKTEIEVQRAATHPDIPTDAELEDWAQRALAGRACALTIRIVEEQESLDLNAAYRGRQAPTNVLSFEAGLPEHLSSALQRSGAPAPLGDIVICASLVAQEAAAQDKPARHHWAHLVVHGILHLLGHRHDEAEDAEAMERLEAEMLAGLDIPDPYAAR